MEKTLLLVALALGCSDPIAMPAVDAGMMDSGAMDAPSDAGPSDDVLAPDSGPLDPHPGWTQIDDERLDILAGVVPETRAASDMPGLAMAAAYTTRELMVVTDGMSNVAAGEEWGPNRSFRIGSVSKTFTAALILQLVGEGVISLDDPLETWLPGWWDDEGIQLRHLITNTSGIVNYNWVGNFDVSRPWTPIEILEWAKAHPRDDAEVFVVGEQNEYSSTNYVLLGLIVEAATDGTFEEALASRITGPLDLRDTYMAGTGEDAPHIVHSYNEAGEDFTNSADPSMGWAAGGMVSTPCDLARWGTELFAGDALSAEMREVMLTPWSEEEDYGHGVFVEMNETEALWGHTGGIGGYSTYMYHYRNTGMTLVVMRNQFTPLGPSLRAIAETALVPLLEP